METRKIKRKRWTSDRKKQRTRSPRKKRMRLWKKFDQVLRILKKRWSTRSLTIDASTTWFGLLTNSRTIGLAMTKVKAWSSPLATLSVPMLPQEKSQVKSHWVHSYLSGSCISWWVLTDQTSMASIVHSIIYSMWCHGQCKSFWDTISTHLSAYASNFQCASYYIANHNDTPQQNIQPPCFQLKSNLSAK